MLLCEGLIISSEFDPGDAGLSAPPRLPEQPEPDPDATPAPSAEAVEDLREIEYEVQEGEKLLKIAETFGVTRRRILRANEGMEEQEPYVAPGDIITVPVSSEMTEAEIMDVEGVQGFVGA